MADYDEVVFVSERLVGIYAAQCAGWTAASFFFALANLANPIPFM